MKRNLRIGLFCCLLTLCGAGRTAAQINTDRMLTVGRNALYFEDYVLSIQYFNQVINAKPFLNEPYFFRAVAKLSLEDYAGAESDCGRAISINPFVINSYQVRGLARVYQGKYDAAINDYRTALEWDPENKSMRHNLILCHIRQKDWENADKEIDTLLKISPKYTAAMSMRSHILMQRKDTAGALSILDKALEIDRYDASLYQDRAIVKATMRNYSEAEKDLNQAIHISPDESGLYINRALVRFYRDSLRAAMSDYDIALEISPDNTLGHYNRGILRMQIGDDNRAIEDFDKVIEAEPDNMMAIFNRGTLRDQTGDLSGAVQDYTAVLAEYPKFIYGYQLRSEARYKLGDRKGGEQDELVVMRDRMEKFSGNATASNNDNTESEDGESGEERTRKESDRNVWNYRKIVVSEDDGSKFSSEYRGKVQNRNVDVRLLQPYQLSYFADNNLSEIDREVRYSAAVELMNSQGKFPFRLKLTNKELPLSEQQIKSLFDDVDLQTAAIAENPDDPYPYFARGLDYYLLQDLTNAEADFTQAIVAGPGLWAAYFCRATVRSHLSEMHNAENQLNLEASIAGAKDNVSNLEYQLIYNDLTKVTDLEPDFAYAYFNRAGIEAQSGDYRQALNDYNEAIKLDDRFAEAYYNRGIALIFLSRVDEGLKDLAKAGELGLYSAYNVMKRFSTADAD